MKLGKVVMECLVKVTESSNIHTKSFIMRFITRSQRIPSRLVSMALELFRHFLQLVSDLSACVLCIRCFSVLGTGLANDCLGLSREFVKKTMFSFSCTNFDKK